MKILHLIGKVDSFIFEIPGIGEPLLRGIQKTAAHLFFRLPYLGGRRCRTREELESAWFKFLSRFGIFPTVTREDGRQFSWLIDACPYGFSCSRDRSVCDAVMDLDRTYTHLLGGELEIVDRIPLGADVCSYVTHLRE